MCRFSVGTAVTLVKKKKKSLRHESKPTAHTSCVFFFFGETVLMRRFKTLASAYKCPEMP